MKIGVISDTHIPTSALKLPKKVFDTFKDCDLIVHAGDSGDIETIHELEKITETKAVWGNMDGPDIREKLPETLIFEIGGKKIGVFHGKGSPGKIIETVKSVFPKKIDAIIFGHSHMPFNEVIDGTLFFNPGSPTDRVFAPYRSIGVIEINNGELSSYIINIDE